MKINVTAIALLLGIMSSNEAIFGMGKHPRNGGDDTSEHTAKESKITPTALNAVENPKSQCRICLEDFLLSELEVLHSSKTSSSETIDHTVCKKCFALILNFAKDDNNNKPLTCLTCRTDALTHPAALSYNLEYWINAHQVAPGAMIVAQTASESTDLEIYRKGLQLFSILVNKNYAQAYAPAAAAAEKASIDFSYDTRQLGLKLFNDLIFRYSPIDSNLLAAAQAGETKHSFYVQSASLDLYKMLVLCCCTEAFEPATRAALNALTSISSDVRKNAYLLLLALVKANHGPACAAAFDLATKEEEIDEDTPTRAVFFANLLRVNYPQVRNAIAAADPVVFKHTLIELTHVIGINEGAVTSMAQLAQAATASHNIDIQFAGVDLLRSLCEKHRFYFESVYEAALNAIRSTIKTSSPKVQEKSFEVLRLIIDMKHYNATYVAALNFLEDLLADDDAPVLAGAYEVLHALTKSVFLDCDAAERNAIINIATIAAQSTNPDAVQDGIELFARLQPFSTEYPLLSAEK